jgi:hypothetical protein
MSACLGSSVAAAFLADATIDPNKVDGDEVVLGTAAVVEVVAIVAE